MNLEDLSLIDAASAIRSGSLSPAEYATALLSRIDSLESRIHAWTTIGSDLFKDFIPAHDARAVRKLKEAGAIILGKTVTTMFANLDPGPTRNPWNVGHTPGGSSSGSAAAVAARMCPAAIGSQTIGSVGRPAAFCGIASLVPPQKRISLRNVFPLAWSLDHVGIFGRSVADLELMRAVLGEKAVLSEASRELRAENSRAG